ncbi:SDR family NAD(P)-dependent oxidoreductase [Aeromicrobium ginsengisoli]|uniref:SDR family oxidoreductase n=1 Tax=Aeromicrobium ginsengisoli TaxID=363867 RepID=A0A5M4FJL7_9ACTN|nr:SDR family oxidoreductase [Aeromicrobium ginsengisoli]KAA1400251.1 SDR family oxidoreductase [Aeromicrobium ginsengisoli]
MNRFEQRSVLVTGGARGIGASHVRRFVDEGARVFFGDINDGAALADELGDAAQFHPLDVSSESSWVEFVGAAEAAHGPATVLVNNAAMLPEPRQITDLPLADWQRVLDVNLNGAFLGIKHAAPAMAAAGGGSIIVTSSALGMIGSPLLSGYVASKWALRGLTQTAALELARDGIRVNSVHPGYVRTPMNDGISEDNTRDYPVPRFAEPEEISAVVLFLASEDASFVTGAEYQVDGGATSGVVASIV